MHDVTAAQIKCVDAGKFLENTLAVAVASIYEQKPVCEVDPTRLTSTGMRPSCINVPSAHHQAQTSRRSWPRTGSGCTSTRVGCVAAASHITQCQAWSGPPSCTAWTAFRASCAPSSTCCAR